MSTADRLRRLVDNDVVTWGDNAARARLQFQGLTPAEMALPYGESGKTRAQVLSECEASAREAVEACALLRRLLGPVRP